MDNPNALTAEGKLFEEALIVGDTAKIKKLISRGFYINQIFRDLPPLSLALSKGYFQLVELLISSGADVCQLDASGKFCPMFYAIRNKCPKNIIRRLILAGAPINGIVEYNFKSSALHLAVYSNQKSIIKCLLSLSANVNSKDKNGMTPLHVAVQENHPNVIKLLDSKGAEMDAECYDKFTPLMLAIHDNNANLVELLIVHGSDVNHEPQEPKYSYQKPLNYAAGLGFLEIIQILLQHGADAKPTSKFNDSPLHSMAHSDMLTDKSVILNAIELLIEHGGDLNSYNNVGQNPLHSSIISRNTVVTKSLLKVGASVQSVTMGKDTPLHLAAYTGNSVAVELLLNSGADMNAPNSFNLTPYDLALKQGDADTVRCFWRHGQLFDDARIEMQEDVNEGVQRLVEEQKKFFHAISCGMYTDMVNALKNGAEPKGGSLCLQHPLHYSVSKGYVCIAEELLNRGVPVGRKDENGETALHLACKSGNALACMALLAHGACYNCLSRSGKTPFGVALANKLGSFTHIVVVLQYIDYLFNFAFSIEELVANLSESPVLNKFSRYHRYSPIRTALNCVNRNGRTLLAEAISKGFHEQAQTIMNIRLKYLAMENED